jgi:hypothetical protein
MGIVSLNEAGSSPLPRVCSVPSAPAILKCILEVAFCEGVQHHMRFCLSPQLCQHGDIFSQGNREVTGGQVFRVGWVEDDSHAPFDKRSLVKKNV